MKLSAFGMSVEASGRTVIAIVLAIAVVAYGFWHEHNTGVRAETLRDAQLVAAKQLADEHRASILSLTQEQQRTTGVIATMTCVLTLSEAERTAFRQDGRYCGSYSAGATVREHIREEPRARQR